MGTGCGTRGWVASGRSMRLLCHCRVTRQDGAGCRKCHCQPLAECIEREATRQMEGGGVARAAPEAAAFMDGAGQGGGRGGGGEHGRERRRKCSGAPAGRTEAPASGPACESNRRTRRGKRQR